MMAADAWNCGGGTVTSYIFSDGTKKAVAQQKGPKGRLEK